MSDPEPENTARQLRCMEVWGGNAAAQNALSVPGLDAWVWTRPQGESNAGGDLHYVPVCGCGQISRFTVADAVGRGETADRPARRMRRLMCSRSICAHNAV